MMINSRKREAQQNASPDSGRNLTGGADSAQDGCRVWLTETRHNEDKTTRGRIRYEQS